MEVGSLQGMQDEVDICPICNEPLKEFFDYVYHLKHFRNPPLAAATAAPNAAPAPHSPAPYLSYEQGSVMGAVLNQNSGNNTNNHGEEFSDYDFLDDNTVTYSRGN